MELPTIFRKPKYKRFEYRPRTYDARKREIQLRQDRRRAELKIDNRNDSTSENINERELRTAYIKDRFSEYRMNSVKKNNVSWLIMRTLLCLGLLFFAFLGIGQFSIDFANKKFLWNDYLSYAILLICIIYFTFRIEGRRKN